MSIQPIETQYKGYRFRSRLEARWAVFFETYGMQWVYEPEGFDMEGVWYLPDFYLPDNNVYVEVKASYPSEEEIAKCFRLAHGIKKSVLILYGNIPDPEDKWDRDRWGILECQSIPSAYCKPPYNRGFFGNESYQALVTDAYRAARSARFEHGENGT